MNDFFDDERIIEPVFIEEDAENANSLRPLTLDEFVGQQGVKENLAACMQTAKARGETLSPQRLAVLSDCIVENEIL